VANEHWRAIQVRIFSDGQDKNSCSVKKDTTLKIINNTFSELTKSKSEIIFESLYLGRIIYNEWLSRHLVDRSLEEINWSTESGRPKNGHKIAAIVEKILEDPTIVNEINKSSTIGGYRVTGFSCEKILVSSSQTKKFEPDWTPTGKKVPYDAMCWLKLSPIK
jgi:hypothetical protein